MEHIELRGGHVEVICGPMFAGKTEELLRRTTRLKYAKKKFKVFKPLIDNRYAENKVVSHSKLETKAINLSNSHEIYQHLNEDLLAVIIDEVQFFDESVIDVIQDLANKGYRVICAGLDLDFRGEPFGIIPNLLAIAEHVTKLTAICVSCGNIATRTQRIINGSPANYDDEIVILGAEENYEARCRQCHVVLRRDK